MHLLLHIPTPDFAVWKTAFDEGAENRRLAGLTVMQIWRGADSTDAHVLMQANDRAKAQAWVDKTAALGEPVTAHFLRTA